MEAPVETFYKQLHSALLSGEVEQVHNKLKDYKKSKAMNKGTKKLLDEFKDEDSMSALHLAVDQCNEELTSFLIAKGAEINALDRTLCTPLLTAASKGYLNIVKILLEQKKIDVNIPNIDKTCALHYIARLIPSGIKEINLTTEIMQLMIKRKVDITVKNKTGETAIHQATRAGNENVISILAEREVKLVNEQNLNGESPLHYAVILGRAPIVEILLDLSADRNIKSKTDESPIDIALRLYGENADNKEKGTPTKHHIIELLLNHHPQATTSKKEQKAKKDTLVKYDRLATAINETQFFANSLSFLVDKADYDRLAKALIHVTVPAGTTVPLIRGLITVEFEKSASEPASILRGNCPASKVMGVFSRRIGQEYLTKCVGAIVRDLVSNEKIDFELDRNRITSLTSSNGVNGGGGLTDDEIDRQIERNKEALLNSATSLLKRITSPDKTQNLPREIRAIAGFIAEEARKHTPEREFALVGGFIMLRLINPAIVAPESYGMLPWGTVPSNKARRNLILLTKLIQNLSNCVEFGVKEPHMILVNSFIVEHKDELVKWFAEIVTDPLKKEGEDDWADCKTLHVENWPGVASMDLNELIFLHRLIYDNMNKLKELLAEAKDKLKPKDFNNSLRLLGELEKWEPEKSKTK